jgi:hypothetical protein
MFVVHFISTKDHGSQVQVFCWWRKQTYQEKCTNLSQVNSKIKLFQLVRKVQRYQRGRKSKINAEQIIQKKKDERINNDPQNTTPTANPFSKYCKM